MGSSVLSAGLLLRDAQKLESAGLNCRELGIEREGGVGLGIHRHGVSGDGGEVAKERAEAVDRQAVIGALCERLAVCSGGAACLGDDGSAGGLGGGLVVIVEQDGREHLAHVPLDIVGEHAQKHVGAHAIGTAMMTSISTVLRL